MSDLVRKTYEDIDKLAEQLPARPYIDDAAVKVRDAACFLYKNHPGWVAGGSDPLGAKGALHGLWQGICGKAPAGLPTPQQPPSGGQCPLRYDVKGFVGAFCPNPESAPATFFQNILGPITGFYVSTSGPRDNPPSQCRVYDIKIGFTDGEGVQRSGMFTSQELNGGGQVPVGASFAVVGGGSDSCGSSLPVFNPEPPSAIELAPEITVNVSPDVTINAPITVLVPPIPPALNFRFGDLNFYFDIGGVTIDFSPDVNPSPRPPAPTSPRPSPPNPGAECKDYTKRFDDIDFDLDRLLDCDRCDLEKNFQAQQIASGSSGSANVPANTYGVAVNITQLPDNKRFQSGESAPRVLYAGWGWFIYNAQMGDRQPIDADGKLLSPENEFPPTGFAYTLYEGFSGTATARYYTLPQG